MKTNSSRTATRTASWTTRALRRKAKPWCGAAAILPFLAATSASAQQPGDTVRVSGALVGVVVEADSAGLLLSSGYAPYAVMRSLELWRGTENLAGRGFKYGFVAGGILGGVVGVGMAYGFSDGNPGEYLLAGLILGSGAGVLAGWLGSLIGSTMESDIWTPVPIPGGLSLRFAVGGR